MNASARGSFLLLFALAVGLAPAPARALTSFAFTGVLQRYIQPVNSTTLPPWGLAEGVTPVAGVLRYDETASGSEIFYPVWSYPQSAPAGIEFEVDGDGAVISLELSRVLTVIDLANSFSAGTGEIVAPPALGIDFVDVFLGLDEAPPGWAGPGVIPTNLDEIVWGYRYLTVRAFECADGCSRQPLAWDLSFGLTSLVALPAPGILALLAPGLVLLAAERRAR